MMLLRTFNSCGGARRGHKARSTRVERKEIGDVNGDEDEQRTQEKRHTSYFS